MAKAQETTGIPAQGGQSSPDSGSETPSVPSAQEVVAAQVKAGEIVTRNQQVMQTFIDWQVQRASTTDADQYEIMAQIIAEIMDAKDVEEVLTEKSALHARDIIGVALIMHGFELREGTYEDSQTGYYAAITASRPGSDVTRVITCGGMKVLAKLWKLEQFGEWPQVFYFTEKRTSNGYGVLDIVRPPL